MVKTGHPVAIKFVPKTKRTTAEYELVIYKQLNAYKNPKIEDYGIPNVYYHGKWESFILTAITKLDQSFEDIQKIHPILPLDMMILFRDFVSFYDIQLFKMVQNCFLFCCIHVGYSIWVYACT